MPGKVMLFIFEGTSDKNTLTPYINELIEECKLALTVEIIGGDKTSSWIEIGKEAIRNEYEWTPANIRQKMIERIKRHIKSGASIPGLRQKDIYKIYYVTDTDDCFQHPERPERLNKSRCMRSIFSFTTLELGPRVEVPIELIFFARELEHVTINSEAKLTLEEKNKLAIDFSAKVCLEEGMFEFTFIENGLKIWDSFSESYRGIISYVGRACNMNNLLEEISNFRKKKYDLLIEEIENMEAKVEKINTLSLTSKVKKEKEMLDKKIRLKNKEKTELGRIMEKRENALKKYLTSL